MMWCEIGSKKGVRCNFWQILSGNGIDIKAQKGSDRSIILLTFFKRVFVRKFEYNLVLSAFGCIWTSVWIFYFFGLSKKGQINICSSAHWNLDSRKENLFVPLMARGFCLLLLKKMRCSARFSNALLWMMQGRVIYHSVVWTLNFNYTMQDWNV